MNVLQEKTETQKDYEENLIACMNSMYNLGLRLTRNEEEAKDLVQEASLRGFRFYHKYEQGTNFKAWILTILRNLFINQYRKTKAEPAKTSYDDIEGFVSMPQITGVDEEIFGESVHSCLEQLPEEMRTVITLFYVEGLAYKEIAEVMKCPIGTVMSRLHMARQSLKKRLMRLKGEGV